MVSNNIQNNKSKLDNNIKNVATLSQNIEPIKNNENQDYEISTPSLSLAQKFEDIKSLENAADLIIEGKAKSTKTIMFQDVPLTISEIEVYEVYKTDDNTITKGSTICMGENGGILSKEYLIEEYKKKFGTEPKDAEKIKPVKVMPDGIAPMEPGDHVLMFAIKAPELKENKCYFVLGAYQGKYNISNDKVKHQVPEKLEAIFKDKVTTKKELIDKIKNK